MEIRALVITQRFVAGMLITVDSKYAVSRSLKAGLGNSLTSDMRCTASNGIHSITWKPKYSLLTISLATSRSKIKILLEVPAPNFGAIITKFGAENPSNILTLDRVIARAIINNNQSRESFNSYKIFIVSGLR